MTVRAILALAAAFLAAGCSGSSIADSDADWAGRREAVRIVELLGKSKSGSALTKLIRALDKDPADLEAGTRLKSLAQDLYLEGLRKEASEKSPAEKALPEAYYSFLSRQLYYPGTQRTCGQGHEAFRTGRLLLAADRFELCRRMRPKERWLREALVVFDEKLIPAAVRAESLRLGSEVGSAYTEVYLSILDLNWDRALAALRQYSALAGDEGLRGAPHLSDEIADMEARLKSRVSVARKIDYRWGLAREIRRLRSVDPDRAVVEIESFYYYSLDHSDRRVTLKVRELLRQSYARSEFKRWTGSRRDLSRLMEAEPDTARASALLQEFGTEKAVSPDQLQDASVEAYYNRGLRAYLAEDLEAAAREWKSALRLDPDHPPSRAALSRIGKELSPS